MWLQLARRLHRKRRASGVAPVCSRPLSPAPTGKLRVALVAVLLLGSLPATVSASDSSCCPGIHVTIQNIRNNTGAVACALFDAPEGFPSKFLRHATRIVMMKIRDTRARCDFLDIPPGSYALAVIHDENMDGKLATNWLGVPREGYGFSSGAEASMSAPSFEAARFAYGGENLELTITLTY